MLNVNKIISDVDCDLCNKLLVDPIVLPCGNTICKTHFNDLINKSKDKINFKCCTCQNDHLILKSRFVNHLRLQNLLKLELN